MSQNLVKIYDGRNGFWQWDKGQRLVVLNDAVTNVHLSHKGEKSSRELEIKLENSMRICDIPDVFLQIPKNLVVYAVEQDYKEACTITSIEFAVKTRPQPDGYMSVHDNEYDDINSRISSLEDAVGLGRPIDAELSMVSIRPVQNKVITQKINSIDEAISIIVDWQNEVNADMSDIISHTISVNPQELTETQKAQARANIGAADFVPVDAELDETSTSPVQNKVVTAKFKEVGFDVQNALYRANIAYNTANAAQQTANAAGSVASVAQNTLSYEIEPKITNLETTIEELGEVCDFVKKNEQGISSLQGFDMRINSIEEQVSDIDTTITKNTSDINETNERVDALENVANDVPAILDDLGQQISDLETKVDEMGDGITVDDALSTTSENPVQNKAVTAKINEVGGMAHSAYTGLTVLIPKVTELETKTNNIDGTASSAHSGVVALSEKVTALEKKSVLVVSCDGEQVSHDLTHIYEHVQNGGRVLMRVHEDQYLYPTYIDNYEAWFYGVTDDAFIQWVRVGENGSVLYDAVDFQLEYLDEVLANHGNAIAALETQVGDIDTALDDIITIQEALIDSALPVAEGVEF